MSHINSDRNNSYYRSRKFDYLEDSAARKTQITESSLVLIFKLVGTFAFTG